MPEEPRIPADLVGRLPATFGPALHDQLRQWRLLFPAERRQLQAQLDYLSRLPKEDFDRLFAVLFDLETRMALPHPEPGAGMSVRDVGILARSPLYPKWRAEVARVFGSIDASAAPAAALPALPRLLVAVLPSGLPLQDQPLWPELSPSGAWRTLDRPFGELLAPLVEAIANRTCPPALEEDERTWIFECESRLSGLAGLPVFSWTALEPLRKEFLRRLNAVARDLRAVDQAGDELKRADLSRLLPPALAANARRREFLRTLLLSGNGALVFSNSFIEWGASEALRRAQPQALVACFGIRPKLKPFSSLVLFEDQHRANPSPDQPDPAASLIDALLLSRYVCLAAERVGCYPGHTLTLLAACDAKQVLMIGPPAAAPRAGEDLTAAVLRWLA